MLCALQAAARSNRPDGRRWFLHFAWCALLSGAGLAAGTRVLAAADAGPQTVQLVVDFGDGAEVRLTALAHRAGMTALDATVAASAHPHGVKFKLRGTGSTAFVTQIGDLKNEGGGAKSRNWTYSVDGEPADVGVGAFELKPGNIILWKFGPADYNR